MTLEAIAGKNPITHAVDRGTDAADQTGFRSTYLGDLVDDTFASLPQFWERLIDTTEVYW